MRIELNSLTIIHTLNDGLQPGVLEMVAWNTEKLMSA
jgi:hypothetical protein